MKRFRLAFAVITVVLFLHGLGLSNNWYGIYGWFDIVMHFLGGLAMGVLGLALLKTARADRYLWLLRVVWVLGFVALIGIAWEWMEFLVDRFFALGYSQQPSIADTMADFFFDLLGGSVAFVLFGRGKE